jgi:hypothetical protein
MYWLTEMMRRLSTNWSIASMQIIRMLLGIHVPKPLKIGTKYPI